MSTEATFLVQPCQARGRYSAFPTALIPAFPLLLLTALAIKLEDHGPVFYKQKRCTKNGEVFEILVP